MNRGRPVLQVVEADRVLHLDPARGRPLDEAIGRDGRPLMVGCRFVPPEFFPFGKEKLANGLP